MPRRESRPGRPDGTTTRGDVEAAGSRSSKVVEGGALPKLFPPVSPAKGISYERHEARESVGGDGVGEGGSAEGGGGRRRVVSTRVAPSVIRQGDARMCEAGMGEAGMGGRDSPQGGEGGERGGELGGETGGCCFVKTTLGV